MKYPQTETRGHISRKDFIKTTTGATAALLLGCTSIGPRIITSKSKTRPNILLITTDQQHINTISANGCPYVHTPGMDYLSENGVVFENSYCSNPVCSPSRSSMLTGRATSETGVYTNGKSIIPDVPNMGEWFGENSNYDRVYAGKWHLPATYESQIPGFDVLTTGIMGHGILGDTTVSLACEGYLRNRSSQRPFLMVVSFMQPHDICEWLRLNQETPKEFPYPEIESELPPLPGNFSFDPVEPEYLANLRARHEPARGGWSELHWRYYLWSYYRHVEMVDNEIGRILNAVMDKGYDRDTIIIFTSDHGEGMAHHGCVRKNTSYDEALKVPLTITGPDDYVQSGLISGTLASGMDILPTICDFAGIDGPEYMRGRSLRPGVQGSRTQSSLYIVAELALNRGRVVRSNNYKYVTYHDDEVEQLYDMVGDPGETTNLAGAGEYSDNVEQHRMMLKDWEGGLHPVPGLPAADAWWR